MPERRTHTNEHAGTQPPWRVTTCAWAAGGGTSQQHMALHRVRSCAPANANDSAPPRTACMATMTHRRQRQVLQAELAAAMYAGVQEGHMRRSCGAHVGRGPRDGKRDRGCFWECASGHRNVFAVRKRFSWSEVHGHIEFVVQIRDVRLRSWQQSRGSWEKHATTPVGSESAQKNPHCTLGRPIYGSPFSLVLGHELQSWYDVVR